jgi:hypothetical protein
LVLKSIFGKKSVLFGGNIYEIGLNRFIENNDKGVLKSDVLIAPGHGAPTLLRWNFDRENIDDRLAKYTNDILNAVRPKVVIASFSKPRNGANWKRSFKRNPANDYLRLARNAFKEYMQADKFYNTDEDLTVLIKIESMKEMLQIKKEKSDMLKKNYEHHDVDTNMEDNQY